MSYRNPSPLRPSKTAELAAAVRALHLRRDPAPIFEDHLALAMCGPLWRTVVSSKVLSRLIFDGLLRDVYPIMPAVYVRARFGEDKLETAVRRGVDQYIIIIGAALHDAIQMTMGWTFSHLWEFDIDGRRYGDPSFREFGDEPPVYKAKGLGWAP